MPQSILNRLTTFGATGENVNAVRSIVLSNLISLVGFGTALILFVLQGTLIAWDSIAFFSLLISVFFVVPLLLNYFVKGLSGRIFLGFYLPSAVLLASVFGKLMNDNPAANFETQFYDYRFFLMASGIIAVVLYDRSNQIWSNISLGFVILVLLMFDPIHNYFGVGYFQSDQRDPTYYFTNIVVVLAFIAQVVGMLFLRKKTYNDEDELKKLSLIAEKTNNGVFITDQEFAITWTNSAFEKISGYQFSEIVGKTVFEILHEDGNNETSKYIKQKISSHEAFVCEVLNRNKDGKPYWTRMNGQPFEDHEGIFKGFFSIEQDITQEKEMILQLQMAKEKAEESDRLKTIFLGNLSHEVRTPLQGILGFTEILETPGLPKTEYYEYLGIVKRRARDVQNIIESLLDLASLETGEIKAFPIQTNLCESAEIAFNKIQQDTDFKNRQIELILENNLGDNEGVLIDPQHLQQVMTNLLNNAVKFTDHGTIKLTCEKEMGNFQISVIDTGIGISPDKIEHIFMPFRQVHEGINRSKGGIGLGLSICKKMIQLWGGSIEVTSEVGKGSRFRFTIPNKGLN
jgi:PAS domain S-box-containing protein